MGGKHRYVHSLRWLLTLLKLISDIFQNGGGGHIVFMHQRDLEIKIIR